MVDGFITFGLPLGVIGYLAAYLKLPKISPNYGFFITFILSLAFGVLNLFYSAAFPPESEKFVSWEFYPILGTLSSLIFIIPSVFIIISFFQQASLVSEEMVKIKSIGFGIAFSLAVLAAGLNLIFADFARSNSSISDTGLTLVSLIIFFIFIFIPNVAQVPYNKGR